MTNPADARRETETLLRTMEGAAAALVAVALLVLTIGGWVGIRTVTYSVEGFRGAEHPRLGLGYVVLTFTVAVAVIAASVSWVLFTYARPRLLALRAQDVAEQQRLALEGW